MKKMIGIVFGLLLVVCSFAANKRFDTMVIFGDSMSDTGNLYRFMWNKLPISPPYYQGRFSNGPLWIEQLYSTYYPQDYVDGFQNYAVGGAGAVFSYKQNLPFTLGIEVNDYLYWNTYGKKDTTLYTIWIGANNYLNGPTNIESITDSVVNAIGDSAERLIRHGGNKFLIPNLPNLSLTPQVVKAHLQPLIAELITIHNRKLAVKVEQLQLKYPDATFVYFDVFSFFSSALEHAQDFGISNITDPCYMGSYSGWLLKYRPKDETLLTYLYEQDSRFAAIRWDMIKNNPELREAAETGYIYHLLPLKNKAEPLNCEEYAFWDHVHPTTRVHYYLAQKARDTLDAAGLTAFTSEMKLPKILPYSHHKQFPHEKRF